MTVEDRLEKHLLQTPRIAEDAYVAPEAVIMGDVEIASKASVWPCCVLRGDIHSIRVGEGSNVQDGSVVHLADNFGVEIGKYVTIGHMAMIHACTIEDECLIGMHATVLDGAKIGARSIVGAHSLVKKGMEVPPGSLVMGAPAKVVRALSEDEQAALKGWAEKYVKVSAFHKAHRKSVNTR